MIASATIPDWRVQAPAGVSLAAAKARPQSGGRSVQVLNDGWLTPYVRDRWMGATARGWTPDRVDAVLRGAISGDHQSQWELFDLMEDTWPRLQKNLNEIKRSVRALNWSVNPWSEDDAPPTDQAKDRAAAVSRAIWTMRPEAGTAEVGFGGLVYDLLDAWGKGTVVIEVDWEVRPTRQFGELIAPRAARWVHPRFYGWSTEGWIGLRLGATQPLAMEYDWRRGQGDIERFPDHKFLVGIAQARSGHPLGTALLRPLAWWWITTNFSAEWWLNYAQIFGVPIRWATYNAGADSETLNRLDSMLANMGSAAYAYFPEGTQLNLLESTKGATGTNPQEALLEHADRLCDIVIIGQTLTTDVGSSGSLALGDVHASVRDQIILSAGDWCADVLNQQLVRSVLQLNWGEDEEIPELRAAPAEVEDEKAAADRDAILLQHGVEMPASWFYQRHKIPLPAEGETTVGGALPAPAAKPPAMPWAAHARLPMQAKAAQEQLVDHVMTEITSVEAKWLAGVRPHFRRLVAMASSRSVSDQEFLDVLQAARRDIPELFQRMNIEVLREAMERAMGSAMFNGAMQGFQKRGLGRPATGGES